MPVASRRRFRSQLYVGLLLAMVVVLTDSAGGLLLIEQKLYDLRCRSCQFFMRPPSPPVHVDIDSNATSPDAIGRLPWSRDVLASLIEEIYQAGAKVVVLDMLFSEPTAHDDALARSMTGGRSIPAVELEPAFAQNHLHERLRGMLAADLTLTDAAARQKLESEGVPLDHRQRDFVSDFVDARKDAMLDRILREVAGQDVATTQPVAWPPATTVPSTRPALTVAELRSRLLPTRTNESASSPLNRLVQEQYDFAMRTLAMSRFFRPQTDVSALIEPFRQENRHPLVLPVAQAVSGCGFANFDPDSDGVVRAVPLWTSVNGRWLPQLGLAALCAALDVPLSAVRIFDDRVVLPTPTSRGDITIPVSRRSFGSQNDVAYCMNVPLLGRSFEGGWETMYDGPKFRQPVNHISILFAFRALKTRQTLRENERVADQRTFLAKQAIDPDEASNFQQLRSLFGPPGEVAATTAKDLADVLLSEPKDSPRRKKLEAAQQSLQEFLQVQGRLQQQLDMERRELAARVGDKTVFVGYSVAGNMDTVTTPLQTRCPGVVVHGAVFSAVMSGELWRSLPESYSTAVTAILGLAMTLIVWRLPPVPGFAAMLGVAVSYALINGLILFDYGDVILGAAGPLTVVVVVWAGMTLVRSINEIGERTRITRRFQSYVDPKVVQYLIDHPEKAGFDGEVREMTVCFTDIAGFTSLTEQMGGRVVPLLSRYMSRMVPVIRRNDGLIHRFMGDGIMFSFNAPYPNVNHAIDAVRTALEMHAELDQFNRQSKEEDFPALQMRVGVSTGQVVVGDAGGAAAGASDYTCLGDVTNFGARLETANRFFGTRTLISERTAEMVRDSFVLRPVGKLQVAGKLQGVVCYEPLAEKAQASAEHRHKATLCEQLVSHFAGSRFDDCDAIGKELEQIEDCQQLVRLYRDLCREHRQRPPERFDGVIVLKEK